MDYERIQNQKPLGSVGGGFSPGKLRSMLLGLEKKRKDEEEGLGSSSPFPSYTFRSHPSQIDEQGNMNSDDCKDVDVISITPECSTSKPAEPLDFNGGHDFTVMPSPSIFEFQKAERSQRAPLAPFSKPAPSKWDDAQKWIASPTLNRPKSGQAQGQAGQLGQQVFGLRKALNRQPSTKVVVEVTDQKTVTVEEPETKLIYSNRAKMENGDQKLVSWEAHPYPVADSYGDSTINLSRHDASMAIQSNTTLIPPLTTARSVSMRDMGTEMTPIASQEPSRTGTPVRATTPILSPTSSRPSTPRRVGVDSSTSVPANDLVDNANIELSEKELQLKTRREIMALGNQLGKMNIAAWASKVEEDKDASTSLKTLATEKMAGESVIEARALAWEEAEKAKYMARFKREEMKIEAWENHKKAKTEAEMRRIEVEVEKMTGQAQDRLLSKLAAVRDKAEEKRVKAEAKRNHEAAKAEQQANYIRRTGRVPNAFSCCF